MCDRAAFPEWTGQDPGHPLVCARGEGRSLTHEMGKRLLSAAILV